MHKAMHQLRLVRISLDSESVATLVLAFVTTRVDQCNAVLSGATKWVTDSTPCSVLWMLPHASSVKQERSTTAWLRSCTTTYTGSMWQIE